MEKGYIQVYTGNGKGKTTAALGLALRAAGAGLKVYIAQFLKQGCYSELDALKRFSDVITIEQFGTGRYIRGETDPDKPFFTKFGSFFMNGTTDFLQSAAESEKGETRNVCNEYGYESVALIPLKVEGRITGAIHVADPRPGRVPEPVVRVLETAAMELGPALERIRIHETLEKQRSDLEQVVREKTS